MATAQQNTDAIKKKYATAEELQSSAEFSKLTPEMQKTALWAFTQPKMETINDKVASGALDVSQATIEPPKQQVQPQAEIKTETPATVVAPTPAKVEKQTEIKTAEQLQAEQDKIRYNDDSEQRLNEISANLNDAVTKNPNSLKTLEAFKNTYSVDKNIRSAKQVQNMLDWYAWYQKWVNLGLTPVNDIMEWYTSGTITATDLESLKSSNPSKYAEVQTAIENKKALKKFQEELYGVQESTNGIVDTTTDIVDNNLFEEYKNTINSDEAKTLNTSIADQDWKITKLKQSLVNIEKDIAKRYEGTGATKDKIAYIVAKEWAEIQRQISELSIEQNTNINKYNSLVNTAKDIMTLWLQEKTAEQQERQAKMQELGFYYQYTPEGMTQMATAKYNAENPDLDSTNVGTSTMALNQTLDAYYKDFGDIIQRSKAEVVWAVQKLAKDKGISVSQAFKENFITPLQDKKEYKSLIDKKYAMDTNKSVVNINGVDYMMDANGNISSPNVPVTVSTVVWSGMAWAWLRNNNPWNIKDTTFGTPLWTDTKWFAQFATPEDWFDALVEKIKFNQTNTKSKYYWNTILQYFQKYAPSTDGNNPTQYAQSVAQALWVTVNTKISDVDATKFAAQIAKHDSWYDYSTYGQFRWLSSNVSDYDYSRFNNTTFKPQDIKDEETKKAYQSYLIEKQRVFNDPEATAEDILRVSLWGWDISDTSLQKLDKFSWVLAWLWEITKSVNKANSWPILWIISSNNPYDTKAQLLKAQLTSITPALARWVYWEVWVLTDNDIRLYQQTIPNLRQTKDVQQAVLAMTLKTVQRGMENSLKTQARAGKDVSAFIGELKSIQSQVSAIEYQLWIKNTDQPQFDLNYIYSWIWAWNIATAPIDYPMN